MMRHAPRIAAITIASVALGSMLALATPTELRSNRNSTVEQLSAPQIVEYPGADHVLTGPDSYPVTYSPQYLAVVDAAERARLQNWQQPPLQDVGYDQPDAARDAAIVEGTGEVTVRRGAQATAAAPEQDPGDLAMNDVPQG